MNKARYISGVLLAAVFAATALFAQQPAVLAKAGAEPTPTVNGPDKLPVPDLLNMK